MSRLQFHNSTILHAPPSLIIFLQNCKVFFFIPVAQFLSFTKLLVQFSVFFNKGRMMGNGNDGFLYTLLISLYTFSVEENNVFIYMFHMWDRSLPNK